jgi:hypothetical protein
MISSQNSMVLGNGLGDKEGASTRAMILWLCHLESTIDGVPWKRLLIDG